MGKANPRNFEIEEDRERSDGRKDFFFFSDEIFGGDVRGKKG